MSGDGNRDGAVGVRRIDHIGIVVDDLELVTGFFLAIGFQQGGRMRMEGEWVDRVIGLEGTQSDVVGLNAPNGDTWLELSKFHHPADPATTRSPSDPPHRPPANRRGLRHFSCEVHDLDTVVERLRGRGVDTVGEIVNYENIYRLCYVAGPEGLTVELAERIDGRET